MAAIPSIAELIGAADEALMEGAFRTGDLAPADDLLRRAEERCRGSAGRQWLAAVRDRMGLVAHYRNIGRLMDAEAVSELDVRAEEALFREAFALAEELQATAVLSRAHFGLGLVAHVLRDDWRSALPHFQAALELADALEEGGDWYALSEIHRHLGFHFVVEGRNLPQAVHHLELSLRLRERGGDLRTLPSGLVALGQAELAAGNPGRAVLLLARAVEVASGVGLLPGRVHDAEVALKEALSGRSGADAP